MQTIFPAHHLFQEYCTKAVTDANLLGQTTTAKWGWEAYSYFARRSPTDPNTWDIVEYHFFKQTTHGKEKVVESEQIVGYFLQDANTCDLFEDD